MSEMVLGIKTAQKERYMVEGNLNRFLLQKKQNKTKGEINVTVLKMLHSCLAQDERQTVCVCMPLIKQTFP
jgi:hypothetical protein